MNKMVERIRIEILLDAPLSRLGIELLEGVGVTGYTLFAASAGAGRSGRWTDDQLTLADTKVMILTICNLAKAGTIIAAFEPLLESHGIMIIQSSVHVVRSEKF